MSPIRDDAVWSIDDLELELRKLPGVRAAGFEDNDDMLLVQLHVESRPEIDRSHRGNQPVPVSASRIAARHSDRPVAVEVVRWRSAPVVAPQPVLAASPATLAAWSRPGWADRRADPAAGATEPRRPRAGSRDRRGTGRR